VPELVDRYMNAIMCLNDGACFEYFKINIHTWSTVSDMQHLCQEIK
jgi:hypothetical protein